MGKRWNFLSPILRMQIRKILTRRRRQGLKRWVKYTKGTLIESMNGYSGNLLQINVIYCASGRKSTQIVFCVEAKKGVPVGKLRRQGYEYVDQNLHLQVDLTLFININIIVGTIPK